MQAASRLWISLCQGVADLRHQDEGDHIMTSNDSLVLYTELAGFGSSSLQTAWYATAISLESFMTA
jgi:hypothetical protein